MDTTSTVAFAKELQAHLLGFTPTTGALAGLTLQTRLGGRLYQVAPPDTLTYPFGLMRLMGRRIDGAYNGARETMDVEVQLYRRPRSALQDLETDADLCDLAMQRYVASDALGIVFGRQRQRDTLPPFTDLADREVVTIRLVYPLVTWPAWLYPDAA